MQLSENENIHLYNDDSMRLYSKWLTPTIIISDGPYGVKGFPGDLVSNEGLGKWYEPHIKKWAQYSTPQTTLWFWNTELGWATVHPFLIQNGWDFKACCIWDKGMSHVAGNVNTKTLSKLPVVTEVCVQYVRRPEFNVNGIVYNMKEWLRLEWARTGLPFSKTNEACGVKNAATRKYFTKCHLWYMPPADAFEHIVEYANRYGNESGKPYFSVDGISPLTGDQWNQYRAKFHCPIGLTNVWSLAQLSGEERLKKGAKAVHNNQKPIRLIETIVNISSDEGDVIWDPFGGLFTTAIVAAKLNRICFSSEICAETYWDALAHVKQSLNKPTQLSIEFGTTC